MPVSGQVSFKKKPWLPTPWRSHTEPVANSEVKKHLSEGTDLAVKGPEQSVALPLRTLQDLEEFQSFHEGPISQKIQDKELAKKLRALRNHGVKFLAKVAHKRQEVGAYGAYNALTGDLGISALEVAFAQPLPTISVPNSDKFENLFSKTKLIDQMTSQSSPETKSRHWNLLFQASHEKPYTNKETLVSDAAKLLSKEDWKRTGSDLGVVGELYKGLEGPAKRQKLIQRIAQQTDSLGHKRYTMRSVLALNEAALNPRITDRQYLEQVLKSASRINKGFLGTELAQAYFPKEFAHIEDLTKFATSHTYTKKAIQIELFEAALQNPNANEAWELLALADGQLKRSGAREIYSNELHIAIAKRYAKEKPLAEFALSLVQSSPKKRPTLLSSKSIQNILESSLQPGMAQKSFIREALQGAHERDLPALQNALVAKFHPEASAKINDLLTHCANEHKERASDLLTKAYLTNPPSGSDKELLRSLASSVKNTVENYTTINEIYEGLLKERASSDLNAKVALRLLQVRKPSNLRRPIKLKSVRAISTVFLDSDFSKEQMLKKTVKWCAREDRAFLRKELVEQLYPELAKSIESLLVFSNPKELSKQWSLLSQAATQNLEETDPQKIATQVLAEMKQSADKDRLLRAAAKHRALSNDQAKLITKVTESFKADGDRQVRQTGSRRTLFQLALEDGLTSRDLLQQAVDRVEGQDKAYVRKALGEELFPKIGARVDGIVNFSQTDYQSIHWAFLFDIAIANPDETDVGQLVKKAIKSMPNSSAKRNRANSMRLAGLKALASEHGNARKALACAFDDSGKTRLKFNVSAEALFDAGLDTTLSPKDFFLKVVEEAHSRDKATLTSLLAEDLLYDPKLQVPSSYLEQFEQGELSAPEIVEVIETLETSKGVSETEIEIEDDLIVIGDETLEVDL